MKTYSRIKEAIKNAIGQDEDMTMTCHGREGHGNVFTRAHYRVENLVTKVLYRHDVSKDGKDGAPAIQYIDNFKFDAQRPWTRLSSNDPHKLSGIPEQLQCEEPLFLTAGRNLNREVLKVFQDNGFKEAYIRKWTAQGKGIGLEIVVIVDNEDDFGIYECSLNYYIAPDSERLREELLEIHRRKLEAGAEIA